MKFALMQPYFFPYLGYFSLMQSTDHFMFFDEVQFVKKSWMTRNRLLNLSNGKAFYFRPELQNATYKSMLHSVELKQDGKWQSTMLSQIAGYKHKAQFYHETRTFLEELLSKKYNTLAELNMETTKSTVQYLDISVKIDKYTDHKFKFKEKPKSGDWGREVAIKANATHYINASGGEEFIFSSHFRKNNISLGFIKPNLQPYDQKIKKYVAGLSILDVLLFNGVENTSCMIKDYKIEWKN